MSGDDSTYLVHILDSIRDIEEMTDGLSKDRFLEEKAVKLAVVKSLEIIGEAAKNVSVAFRKSHPEVPWDEIIKMRNKTVHFYFGVDYKLVWKTVKEDVPELKEKIEKLL